MSGKSEKMAILNMLEQGKITAENATKLLAALGDTDDSVSNKSDSDGRDYGSQAKAPDRSADFKKWAFRFGKRLEATAKDLEPKVQKLAGAVTQKSIEIADTAAKTLASRKAAYEEQPPSASKPAKAPTASSFEKSGNTKAFELAVSDEYANELILRSPKGHINVKGYNGDKATVNVSFNRIVQGNNMEFIKSGGVYQLNYNLDEYESVNIDAYVPSSLFRLLRIESSNGIISIENMNIQTVTVNAEKCHVSAKNIETNSLTVDNLDGPVLLGNLNGEQITVETSNASIDATNTDFKKLLYETTGEAVNIISQGFYKHNDYNWEIRTSNARLKAILPVTPEIGYDIKAYTSLSDVSNGLPDINYVKNERNCIEGKSANYTGVQKKIKIQLYTSNAPLYIN